MPYTKRSPTVTRTSGTTLPAKVDCESKNAIMSVSQFSVPLSLTRLCRDGGVYHCRANGYLIPNLNVGFWPRLCEND